MKAMSSEFVEQNWMNMQQQLTNLIIPSSTSMFSVAVFINKYKYIQSFVTLFGDYCVANYKVIVVTVFSVLGNEYFFVTCCSCSYGTAGAGAVILKRQKMRCEVSSLLSNIKCEVVEEL
jgi:hypothetical protein